MNHTGKDGKKRSRVDKLFSSTNPCVRRIVLLLLLPMLMMDQYLIKWTNQISLFSCSSGKEKIDHRSLIPSENRNIVGGRSKSFCVVSPATLLWPSHPHVSSWLNGNYTSVLACADGRSTPHQIGSLFDAHPSAEPKTLVLLASAPHVFTTQETRSFT